MNAIINLLEKYSDNIIIIQVWFLIVIVALFVWVWFFNRKRYNHLKHQIPATVVKSYLDSIIQNSTALKSSLFRGGGLDVDPNSVPSVMRLTDLPGGMGMDINDIDGDPALKAQVAKLQAQVVDQKNIITELEGNNSSLEGVVKEKAEKIIELEALLAAAGGNDPEMAEKLIAVTKERDELLENLQQYDIISGDLADLKRLKQENEQLKKALADAGGSIDEIKEEVESKEESVTEEVNTPGNAEEEEEEVEPEVVAVETSSEVVDEAAPFAEDAETKPDDSPVAEDKDSNDEEEAAPGGEEEEASSPEDLLSEFEKMLK